VSRAADVIALGVSGVLHTAVVCAALFVSWDAQARVAPGDDRARRRNA
jgi:hypothetical protein